MYENRSQINADDNLVLLHFTLLIFCLHKLSVEAQPTPITHLCFACNTCFSLETNIVTKR